MSKNNSSEKIVTAIIDNQVYRLPSEARYYFQSPNGVWYWHTSKPYKMVEEKSGGKPVDWTPQKQPIQTKSLEGWDRVVISNPPPEQGWLDTVQACIYN